MDQQYIDMILALLVPIIPILSGLAKDKKNKVWVSVAASVALSVARAFTAGEYDPVILIGVAIDAFAGQLAIYQGPLKTNFDINGKMEALRAPAQHGMPDVEPLDRQTEDAIQHAVNKAMLGRDVQMLKSRDSKEDSWKTFTDYLK